MAKKLALRQLFKEKRMSLTSHELSSASDAILKQILDKNLFRGNQIMLYSALIREHELPLDNWFNTLCQMEIYLPKVLDDKGSMEAVLWEESSGLVSNKWGILEPTNNVFIDPKSIDVVVVPMLCFDSCGHRVGFGKGYYDRFLARCAPHTLTIGICFFDAVAPIEDTLDTDVPLDVVVTPRQLHYFN